MKSSASFAWFVVGVAALGGVAWWLYSGKAAASPGGGPPPYVLPVTLAKVELGSIEPRTRLVGEVASAQTARLGFELAGRVAQIAVDQGASVKAGDVLAQLDQRDATAELARATAEAELARRELERWLAGARDEEKRRLAAELAVRKAEADLAEKDVKRGEELASESVISQADLDTRVSLRDAAVARVNAAEEAFKQAEIGSRPEEIAVQRAQVELREAEVQIARRNLDKSTLTAPFNAAVVSRSASLGDSVDANQVVFELVDLSTREIAIEIPSRDAARLARDARAVVTLEEFPEFELASKLDALIEAADAATRNFRGLIRLDAGEDVELRLKPGMFVRVELELAPLRDVLLVPADAVRVVQSGTIVVRAKPVESNGQAGLAAEWVPVRVLGTHAGMSAVAALGDATLAAGEQVVVIGVDLAFPSAPLLPRETAKAAPEMAQ